MNNENENLQDQSRLKPLNSSSVDDGNEAITDLDEAALIFFDHLTRTFSEKGQILIRKILRRWLSTRNKRIDRIKNQLEDAMKIWNSEKDKLNAQIRDLQFEKETWLKEQHFSNCLTALLKKIERLEEKFDLSTQFSPSAMKKEMVTYVEQHNSSKEVRDEMNFFEQLMTLNVVDDVINLTQKNLEEKIKDCLELNDTVKDHVVKILKDTKVGINSINYAERPNMPKRRRLVKWMHYLLLSVDTEAVAIREAVDRDPDVSLFMFCSSVAEMYAIVSKVFNPGKNTIYRFKPTVQDILNSLEQDLDVDKIALRCVEILFSV